MATSQKIKDYMAIHKSCEACGKWIFTKVQPHHIKSRGAGGGDEPENLLRLCMRCHIKIHKQGALRFIKEYPHLKDKIMNARPILRMIEIGNFNK